MMGTEQELVGAAASLLQLASRYETRKSVSRPGAPFAPWPSSSSTNHVASVNMSDQLPPSSSSSQSTANSSSPLSSLPSSQDSAANNSVPSTSSFTSQDITMTSQPSHSIMPPTGINPAPSPAVTQSVFPSSSHIGLSFALSPSRPLPFPVPHAISETSSSLVSFIGGATNSSYPASPSSIQPHNSSRPISGFTSVPTPLSEQLTTGANNSDNIHSQRLTIHPCIAYPTPSSSSTVLPYPTVPIALNSMVPIVTHPGPQPEVGFSLTQQILTAPMTHAVTIHTITPSTHDIGPCITEPSFIATGPPTPPAPARGGRGGRRGRRGGPARGGATRGTAATSRGAAASSRGATARSTSKRSATTTARGASPVVVTIGSMAAAGATPMEVTAGSHMAATAGEAVTEAEEANAELMETGAKKSGDDPDGPDGPPPKKKAYIPSYVQDGERCVVCGDHSTGTHYRAMTCEGCKGFFRRTVQNKGYEKFVCKKNKSCEIRQHTRNSCQYCRYKRCIDAKMDPESVLSDPERQNLRSLIETNRAERQKKLSQILTKEESDLLVLIGKTFKSEQVYAFYTFFEMMEDDHPPTPSSTLAPGILHAVEFIKKIPGLDQIPDTDIMTLMHHHLLDVLGLRLAEVFDKNQNAILFSNMTLKESDLALYPWMTRIFNFTQVYSNFVCHDGVVLGCLAAIRFLCADNIKLEEEERVNETLEAIQSVFLKYIQQENVCTVQTIYAGLSNFEDIRVKDASILSRLSMLDTFVVPDLRASPALPIGACANGAGNALALPAATLVGLCQSTKRENSQSHDADCSQTVVDRLDSERSKPSLDSERSKPSDNLLTNNGASNQSSPIPTPRQITNSAPSHSLAHDAWFNSPHTVQATNNDVNNVQNGAENAKSGRASGHSKAQTTRNQSPKVNMMPPVQDMSVKQEHNGHANHQSLSVNTVVKNERRHNGNEIHKPENNGPHNQHLANGHVDYQEIKIGQPQVDLRQNGIHQISTQPYSRRTENERSSSQEKERRENGNDFKNGQACFTTKCGYESHHPSKVPEPRQAKELTLPPQLPNMILNMKVQVQASSMERPNASRPTNPPPREQQTRGASASGIRALLNGFGQRPHEDVNDLLMKSETSGRMDIGQTGNYSHPGGATANLSPEALSEERMNLEIQQNLEAYHEHRQVIQQLVLRSSLLEERMHELSRIRNGNGARFEFSPKQEDHCRDLEALRISQKENSTDLTSIMAALPPEYRRLLANELSSAGQILPSFGKIPRDCAQLVHGQNHGSPCPTDRDRMIDPMENSNSSSSDHAHPYSYHAPPSHPRHYYRLGTNHSIINALQRQPQYLSDVRMDTPRSERLSTSGNDLRRQQPVDEAHNAATVLSSFVRTIPASFNFQDERAQDLSLAAYRRESQTSPSDLSKSAMSNLSQQQIGRSASFSGSIPDSHPHRRNSGPPSFIPASNNQNSSSFKESPPISSMSSDEGHFLLANGSPEENRRASFSSSSPCSNTTHRNLKKRWLSRHTTEGDNY